jgi:hypothetical protein
VFLVCIDKPKIDSIIANNNNINSNNDSNDSSNTNNNTNRSIESFHDEILNFPEKYGVKYVRGGEIFEMRDEDGVILNDHTKPEERKHGRMGNKRKIRLNLDTSQYHTDINDGTDCYETLNLLIRRKSKENNFRSVLETIRDLMNTATIGIYLSLYLCNYPLI